jgi:hypothetical protein
MHGKRKHQGAELRKIRKNRLHEAGLQLDDKEISSLAEEVRKDTLSFGFDEAWAAKAADLYKKAASA